MDPKRLREETRAEHEATEAAMPLMDAHLTRKVYVAVLATLCPLVESWETWSAAYAPDELKGMVEERRRGWLLRADLQALGAEAGLAIEAAGSAIDWAEIVGGGRCSAKEWAGPCSGFTAAFLGALYVMEGSRLGGRHIARHVETVLELTPGRGDAYFRGAGEATGALWREVSRHIVEIPEEFAPMVVGAARRTFRVFGEALRAGLMPSAPGCA